MSVHLRELKRIREERSVDLWMIVEQAEVSYAEIWNAEYRSAPVKDETANALADVLGVGVRHLKGELPAPPPPPEYPSWLPPPEAHHEEPRLERMGA